MVEESDVSYGDIEFNLIHTLASRVTPRPRLALMRDDQGLVNPVHVSRHILIKLASVMTGA
jgi:hypothetical protein